MAYTAAGTRIWISSVAAPNADTITEFAALTWVEINDVESIGEYGDQYNQVTASTLKDGRVRKAKGQLDAGDLQVTVLVNSTDAGQLKARQAFAEKTLNYGFKIEEPDKTTASGHGTISYFQGKVMSTRRSMPGVDEIVKSNYNVGIDSAILYVDPT